MRGSVPWLMGLFLGLVACSARASDEFDSYTHLRTWAPFGGSWENDVPYGWRDGPQIARDGSAASYRWRRLKFEQVVTETKPPQPSVTLQKTSMSRLSYVPVENLTVRLARGKLSRLDYIMADESLRRTAVSATYVVNLPAARLESTVAWGRSSRKARQSTSGFVLESIAQFSGSQAVFARLEQVGSDEPGIDDAARAWSRLSRLSLGYVREYAAGSGARLQLGGIVSHYQPPDGTRQGRGDASLCMFVARLSLN